MNQKTVGHTNMKNAFPGVNSPLRVVKRETAAAINVGIYILKTFLPNHQGNPPDLIGQQRNPDVIKNSPLPIAPPTARYEIGYNVSKWEFKTISTPSLTTLARTPSDHALYSLALFRVQVI